MYINIILFILGSWNLFVHNQYLCLHMHYFLFVEIGIYTSTYIFVCKSQHVCISLFVEVFICTCIHFFFILYTVSWELSNGYIGICFGIHSKKQVLSKALWIFVFKTMYRTTISMNNMNCWEVEKFNTSF